VILETICAFRFLAAFLPACAPALPAAVGYVEGEYVQIAPIDTARITSLAVRRGDRVNAGDAIASVETTDAEIAVRNAKGQLGQAEAELANILYGRRPEEIAAIEAQLNSAKVQRDDAKRSLDRKLDLHTRGYAPQADLDQAQTTYDVAAARVNELTANLAVANLPSRNDEIEAAKSRVAQARANLDQMQWRLAQRSLTAPAEGAIADIIRRPGEVAGPSAPVVSMLPDGAVKLKVYVPETMVSSLAVGDSLDVRCDGCPSGLTAKISYVARQPEFTPPVIYSLETRQKLVYLIEARPSPENGRHLQPGQIVDVILGGKSI
jgi:HlyD family secretion protein